MFGRREVVERDEGVVPSIVFVMVESVSPFRLVVWMNTVGHGVFGMVLGVLLGLVVWAGWEVVVMEFRVREREFWRFPGLVGRHFWRFGWFQVLGVYIHGSS